MISQHLSHNFWYTFPKALFWLLTDGWYIALVSEDFANALVAELMWNDCRPYAPELNPVEQVWNHSKYGRLADFIPDDIDNLADGVDCSLRYRAGQQNLLCSFFHYTKLKI